MTRDGNGDLIPDSSWRIPLLGERGCSQSDPRGDLDGTKSFHVGSSGAEYGYPFPVPETHWSAAPLRTLDTSCSVRIKGENVKGLAGQPKCPTAAIPCGVTLWPWVTQQTLSLLPNLALQPQTLFPAWPSIAWWVPTSLRPWLSTVASSVARCSQSRSRLAIFDADSRSRSWSIGGGGVLRGERQRLNRVV